MASPASRPVALVTGTNSGVGLALTVQLAATHDVYAGMRKLTPSKRSALDEAAVGAGVSDNITVMDLDVDSDESVAAAVQAMLEETGGRVDVLVNNAGYACFGSVEMLSMETMQAQFNTNLFGPIRCQRAVLPAMRAQKRGKIVNISSVGGVWGQPFNDVYCGSKFALEGMSEAQGAVFRTFGVHVTCVQPGLITTAFGGNAKLPDFAKVPSEYQGPIQSTMAAYRSGGEDGGLSRGQTAEQVAEVIMEKVIHVEHPPAKVQTNPVIQSVFEMQLADVSGEAGVAAAAKRFLAPPPAAEAPGASGK
uniref:Uncharacterized protein n=1 Tax=Rhizochromulina marina TaxID=1034831 RepID=A0A7S2SWM7_9STRA